MSDNELNELIVLFDYFGKILFYRGNIIKKLTPKFNLITSSELSVKDDCEKTIYLVSK